MPFRDISAALGAPHVPATSPSFPLLRDFTSLYLISVLWLTVPITLSQWKQMGAAFGSLQSAGVLQLKNQPTYSRLQMLLGIKRVIVEGASRGLAAEDALFDRSNAFLARVGRFQPLIVILSFVLALFITQGERLNGVYSAFLGPQRTTDSSHEIYVSWWANFDHASGYTVYLLSLTLGVYLVIVQNTVGLASVRLILGFSAIYDMSLDFRNVDGNYGWASIAAVYRTVLVSLALHGTALGFTMAALGLDNWPWVLSMVIVWCVMLPSTTMGPLIAFNGLNRRARAARIAVLVAQSQSTAQPLPDVAREIELVRKARAYPLRSTPKIQFSVLFVAILWPLILTLIQVYFSLHGGTGK